MATDGTPNQYPELESTWADGAAFLAKYWDLSGPGSFLHPIEANEELPPGASRALVRWQLPGVDDAAVERIVARGDGHALYLQEMARATRDGEGDAGGE